MDWKEGDWCFSEYKLFRVDDVDEEGKVRGLGDGIIHKGSYDWRDCMFPLEKKYKIVSEEYNHVSKQIHEISNLNHPDIHRWLVKKWKMACNNIDDKQYMKQNYEELYNFLEEIQQASNKMVVSGVKIFG